MRRKTAIGKGDDISMKSIQKVDQYEKELKLLIGSLKNVLTDVPYDFMYDDDDNDDSDENKDSSGKNESKS